MRILFLTHRLPYAPNRGDRIRAYNLMREMSRFAEVSLCSLAHDADEMSHRERVPFARDVTCLRVRRVPNAVRGALRLPTDRPLTHSLLDARGARTALAAVVKARRPDLVVAFCSGMARFALEPPLNGIPFVLDMVDVDSVKWEQLAAGARGLRRWIYRREARTLRAFEAEATARARVTLVVNDRERLALQAIAPSARVVIVAPGIDVGEFEPPDPPASTHDVIFCGVMNYEPNEHGVCWFASRVWPRVRAAVPDARFLVVGSSPTTPGRHLAVRDRSISIVGAVPDVRPYLWKSAVSVAPLRFARGLQTKVLEALAAGLPTVLTPEVASGLTDAVLRACVTAHDPNQFADAVIRLLRAAPAERRRTAASAPLAALNWSNQLRDLEAILRDGVSGRSPAAQVPGALARSES
jgi:sugar transferase (PEP-CTERM/EpsH1 system associated)